MNLTRTQQRMMDLLSDGRYHSRQGLHTCISDELTNGHSVSVHLAYLRRKLRFVNEDVICVKEGNRFGA
jgi:hypothetical protein